MPKKNLSRKSSHQVYRTSDGTVVPGASTISKVGEDQGFLVSWAYRMGTEGKDYRKVTDEAAGIGSVGHFLVTCHFKGWEAGLDQFTALEIEKGTMVFNKFLETWNDLELTFVANELELVSEQGYGGTIDIVARDRKGRMVMADVKTSPRIYGHFYRQLAGYKMLYNENNTDQIERCVILRIDKKDPEESETRWMAADLSKHEKVFKAQLALYQAMKQL